MPATPLHAALSGVDITTPNVARIYDHLLGGHDNFAADRAAADQIEAMLPGVRDACRANRDFLGRAARTVARSGRVAQYLDIGSGLPTVENVHEVVQREDPAARVVYVDYDPVVCAHARSLLQGAGQSAGGGQVSVVQADMRDPARLIAAAGSLLDLTRPVCLIMCAAIHFVTDDDEAAQVMRALTDPLPTGSILIFSHGTQDSNPAGSAQAEQMYQERVSSGVAARTHPQIAALLDGWDLTPPGLVWAPLWRPDSPPTLEQRADAAGSMAYAAVAVKP